MNFTEITLSNLIALLNAGIPCLVQLNKAGEALPTVRLVPTPLELGWEDYKVLTSKKGGKYVRVPMALVDRGDVGAFEFRTITSDNLRGHTTQIPDWVNEKSFSES